MKEERVTFKSGDLTLEGMIAYPDGDAAGPHRAAVVCHPHPLYGGSMYNNVVDAVLEALHARGFATLRFNFRGVGQSEGEFDNGKGEADDAIAAIRFLTTQKGVRATGAALAGYLVAEAIRAQLAGVTAPAGNPVPHGLVAANGWWELPAAAAAELTGIVGELSDLVSKFDHYLAEGAEADIKPGPRRTEQKSDDPTQ